MERVLEPEVMDTAEDADDYDAMDHGSANSDFVARLVELGASGCALDLGCGPGHIPLLACERLPELTVVGIDLAEHMLSHARRHQAASPVGHRVEFRAADAKGLDFEDARFDCVFSNTILHHIPDPVQFLREVRRVLRPGGVLLIRDLFRPPTRDAAQALVDLHAAGGTPSQRELLLASLCAALTHEELRATADAAGLAEAQLVVDSDRHHSLQVSATGA